MFVCFFLIAIHIQKPSTLPSGIPSAQLPNASPKAPPPAAARRLRRGWRRRAASPARPCRGEAAGHGRPSRPAEVARFHPRGQCEAVRIHRHRLSYEVLVCIRLVVLYRCFVGLRFHLVSFDWNHRHLLFYSVSCLG